MEEYILKILMIVQFKNSKAVEGKPVHDLFLLVYLRQGRTNHGVHMEVIRKLMELTGQLVQVGFLLAPGRLHCLQDQTQVIRLSSKYFTY